MVTGHFEADWTTMFL